MKRTLALGTLSLFLLLFAQSAKAQSLGNAGTIEGTVVDPSGAAVTKAVITIHNAVSGHRQETVSGADGTFRFSNIPPNPYHLEVTAAGFNVFSQDVNIRSAVPVQVKAAMALAGAKSSVTVEAAGAEHAGGGPLSPCGRGPDFDFEDSHRRPGRGIK
jgi:hypothetical protein